MRQYWKNEEGSALGLVLIFVTILSFWLSSILLLTQVSAFGVERMLQKTENLNQVSSAQALVLETLDSNSALGSAAYTSEQQPNCGLGSFINGVSITCSTLSNQGSSSAFSTVGTSGTDSMSFGGVGTYTIDNALVSASGITGNIPDATSIVTSLGSTNTPNCVVSLTETCSGNSGTSIGSMGGGGALCPADEVCKTNDDDDDDDESGTTWPTKCSDLSKTVFLKAGRHNRNDIKRLNGLITANRVKLYKYSDDHKLKESVECSTGNSGWDGKIHIEIKSGGHYFHDSHDNNATINMGNSNAEMHTGAEAQIGSDNKSCNYGGVVSAYATRFSQYYGAQFIFGEGTSASFTAGEMKICAPNFETGRGSAFVSLNAVSTQACIATYSALRCLGATSTNSNSVVIASNVYTVGDWNMPNTTLIMSANSTEPVTATNGITSKALDATCNNSAGCKFSVVKNKYPGRTILVKMTLDSGYTVQKIIVINSSTGSISVVDGR